MSTRIDAMRVCADLIKGMTSADMTDAQAEVVYSALVRLRDAVDSANLGSSFVRHTRLAGAELVNHRVCCGQLMAESMKPRVARFQCKSCELFRD